MYKIVPTYAAGTEVKEIQVGIKLTDGQIRTAAHATYKLPMESCPTSIERAISDAATVHVVREIGKKMWREGSVMCISEKDWQAIIAEAGLVELTGIRIEIDTNLKPGEGHLKPTRKGVYSDEVERELDTYKPM